MSCCETLAKNPTDGQESTSKGVLNLELESWARKLSEQLSKIGLGCIWQDQRVEFVKKKEEERCTDTERQNLFANIKEKRSLIFYSEMKQEWAREEHTGCCTRKERSGLTWFKTGIWKLRGMKGSEKGRCPLCSEDEEAIHTLLKCSETRKWREQFLSRKWLVFNEWIAYKKTINCTNIIELINIGIYLYKTKCKLENKI
jgi:hypothetical protein